MTPTPKRPSRPSRPSSSSSGFFGGQTATVLSVVVAVLVVIGGIVAIGLLVGGGSTPSAQAHPSSTPTQTPPTTPTTPTTSSPTPPHVIALHCSKPPAKPKKPLQFTKPPSKTLAQDAVWKVTLHTNCGAIVMHLNGKVAPQTVSSFLFLSRKGYYNDSPCHRLTVASQGLSVLQCGDPTGTGTGGPGYSYGIENAPKNGQYPTGTVAMARTSDPNSNGSQFFIVYANTSLPTTGGGYSIFGTVTKGLPIVQAIASKGLAANGTAPKQPISIVSINVAKA